MQSRRNPISDLQHMVPDMKNVGTWHPGYGNWKSSEVGRYKTSTIYNEHPCQEPLC